MFKKLFSFSSKKKENSQEIKNVFNDNDTRDSFMQLGESFQGERFEKLNEFYNLFSTNKDSELLLFKLKKLVDKQTEILKEIKKDLDASEKQKRNQTDSEPEGIAQITFLFGLFKERDYREDIAFVTAVKDEIEVYENFKEKINIDDTIKNIRAILETTKDKKQIKES